MIYYISPLLPQKCYFSAMVLKVLGTVFLTPLDFIDLILQHLKYLKIIKILGMTKKTCILKQSGIPLHIDLTSFDTIFFE